jgi:multiple sugar transport system permease protein
MAETTTRTDTTPADSTAEGSQGAVERTGPWRIAMQVFLALTAIVWLAPLVYAFVTSLRPYAETAERGYVSIPTQLTTENYATVLRDANIMHFFWNTMIVTVPAVILILLLSSMVAFGLSRYSFGFNLAMLMLFTAGNLLPQQVVITPLFRLYLQTPIPTWLSQSGSLLDSYLGLILIHVAFQMGFVTFVLSNYMKTVPDEITEAAIVDGAGVWTQYWRVILPLTRPALAALATLEFTWIYNDFFWAVVLMPTDASKRPITTALQNLQGLYFTDNNLIAAGALLAAIPTILVFVLLQKQFVRGLTLGSTKG